MASPGTAGSYQLPDLLLYFQDYHELVINKYCSAASSDSEKWTRGLIHDEDLGLSSLSLSDDKLASMKLSLLGACCFPSCDLTQLSLMMDVWTSILLENQLLLRSNLPVMPRWISANEDPDDYVQLLQLHPVFQRLVPRLSRFKHSTSEVWQQRFTRSIASYRQSEQKAINFRMEAAALAKLDLDDYINFRCNFGGIPIILDLIEAVEGLDLVILAYNERLCTLRRLVGEIIVLSWDVFSYNIDQSMDNRLNIVSLLQAKREYALVHSIKEAGDLISQRLDSFKSLEHSLLSSAGILPSSTPTTISTASAAKSWLGLTGFFSENPQKNSKTHLSLTEMQAHDIALYIRALKDCMVGFLNWTYETDLFFGTKGESVKSFGWVFLLPPSKSVEASETRG
ncbi:hypothetical protein EV361DRAFT_131009 [Lentinula raphanica]|uniref:Terpenoid synthase n=1 Tax=Lentinula raphanica TaxID=153919 RepID=A0AA38PJ35_9AGAR|nr:hypothetical protein F5878DRAFT_219444 [Lentinula raphanica]KAJ3977114.1 hypothetical protein EV361DRAFT_131009 [Lentinula raphanica]